MADRQYPFGVAILAAGRSSRMGRPKMLLRWATTTVIGYEVGLWNRIGALQVVAVISVGDGVIGAELDRLAFPTTRRIPNLDPDRGMFSSIQCAARWSGWDTALSHVVIALGDQPHLKAHTLSLLMQSVQREPDNIWQPAFEGHPHHPVVFPRHIFAQLAAAKQSNLREFLVSMRDRIRLVETGDPGLALDIDSPDDYEKAIRLTSSSTANQHEA
jgi:molybdenum cofactor cytidylyltransferase